VNIDLIVNTDNEIINYLNENNQFKDSILVHSQNSFCILSDNNINATSIPEDSNK
jgi:hypothetical protein